MLTVSCSFALGGAAMLCWPTPARRFPGALRRASWSPPGSWFGWLGFVPVVAVWPLLGAGGVLAVGVLALVCRQEWRGRARSRVELAASEGAASALRVMVAELRSGAHPVLAAEAAAEAVPEAADRLLALAAAARLDGDPLAGGESFPELANAWALARRFGLPMAEVLDATRRDVEAGVGFARRLKAKMAGPRASAAVLTALPLACVLLGEGMGAAPLHVFAATVPGQFLLVLGSLLIWAGTAWCRALTGRVVLR
ncbi:type II secretion system F family protein [Amycolatopsis sp. H20-H5]|uniref:type II secretion system F family protein n=1 Tax=Amycolatopsis sp. H20-H5 TaxID=3046309 RepID=UPI002DB908E1|nr:type II secretion system protein [Amycolatopsis sp. H20-H5]MEC3979537.1 type II secretion system protein [Amycolatopsis sp. H20-H5]